MKHAILLTTGLLLAVSAPAFAHAYPQKASPAKGAVLHTAPKAISIWFDDELQAGMSWLKVTDNGKVVSMDKGHVDAKNRKLLRVNLAKAGTGQYTVDWHALSVDGHPTSGSYTFSVRPLNPKAPQPKKGKK